MSAADIWSYSIGFLQSFSPVIFLIAIIANAGQIIDFIYTVIKRVG